MHDGGLPEMSKQKALKKGSIESGNQIWVFCDFLCLFVAKEIREDRNEP
jgi:hypothetical protein